MTLTVQTCARCGKPFKKRPKEMLATYIGRKYCSVACFKKADWKRRYTLGR